MNLTSRFVIVVKALRQLGVEQVGLYAIYQLGLRTGHYRRQLNASLTRLNDLNREPYINLKPCLRGLPDRDSILDLLGDQIGQLYEQAEEIVNGKVRLFGGVPVPVVLKPPEPLTNWTNNEGSVSQIGGQDIKFIWEPCRFGWAFTLAMAYYLSNDGRYADTFWQNSELFLKSNPAYLGPHWSSAQEVAIRLVALGFALQMFTKSTQASPERLKNLANAIAIHAERIPPTLRYARSQNNNHLITEALGLYTASALLPEHPHAPRWHTLGWKWLQHAFLNQIDRDGTYIQQSTNYHRLMLQAALWAFAVHDGSFIDEPIPKEIIDRLQSSTNWLWKLMDPESGQVPNLGHNDGAYILPLTLCPQHDYRPVVYAAAQTFLHMNLAPGGSWTDMGQWLSSPRNQPQTEVGLDIWRSTPKQKDLSTRSPNILQNRKNGSWATLRVVRFHSRPAHADQLQLDLWWHGLNIAQDPGTYLYNALSPWDNSLTSAFVHNTITVDGQEIMLRAGRFLYLDWAQAEIITSQPSRDDSYQAIVAQHNGYKKIGITHLRKVKTFNDGHWEVTDNVSGLANRIHTARLHWLLPDWEYEIQLFTESTEHALYAIRIRSPYGWVTLKLGSSDSDAKPIQIKNASFQLVRCGNLLYGSGSISPISGWTSPTYGEKIPALSCILEITKSLPIELKSEWMLPNEG